MNGRRSSTANPWMMLALIMGVMMIPTPGMTFDEDPGEPLVTESVDEWTVGGGMLYWAYCCDDNVDCPDGGYLRRRALLGDVTDPITETSGEHIDNFRFMAADERGLYYYHPDSQYISMRPTGAPSTTRALHWAPTPPTTKLKPHGDYVYWGASDGIYRAQTIPPYDGELYYPTQYVYDLAVNDSAMWIMWPTGLHRMPWTGIFVQEWTGSGSSILSHDGNIFFVGEGFGGVQTVFEHDNGTFAVWAAGEGVNIGNLASDGTHVYWVESTGTQDVLMQKDFSLPTGVQPTVLDDAADAAFRDQRVFADSLYAYYRIRETERAIERISNSAEGLGRDIQFSAWEVTQSIQGLDHNVDLVADKPTVVRVYGKAVDGPSATSVGATLFGWRSGIPLEGSPLRSLTGNAFVQQDGSPARDTLGRSWLFKLPESWTHHGTITLEAKLDPRELFDDPDRANNSSGPQDFVFWGRLDMCSMFIPVNTHAPWPSINDPNFDAMIDLATRLWPVPNWRVYHQSEPIEELQVCWWEGILPYPCWGPYELTEDDNWIMASLVTRDIFTDDPDDCARTHYVGMIHPDTSMGTRLGLGNTCLGYTYVKLAPHDPPEPRNWQFPKAGFSLAHETGHNYFRYHVDCGIPDDDPYIQTAYPYPDCQLSFSDLGHPSRHFGFDTKTLTPLDPGSTADLMSYSSRQWTSDFNYKHFFLRHSHYTPGLCAWEPICDDVDCVWDDRKTARRIEVENAFFNAQHALKSSSGIVLASGVIGPEPFEGTLDNAWTFPVVKASDGLLNKWYDRVALDAKSAPERDGPSYNLRLVDPEGAILHEAAIMVTGSDKDAEGGIFSVSIPEPPGTVARVELVVDDAVIDYLDPGPSSPELTILHPTGGEHFNESIFVEVQGSDADAEDLLFFTIQYSPNWGSGWRALLSNVPAPPNGANLQVDIDLSSVPGTTSGGLIQVLASDGYHTTVRTSNAFTVEDRGPTVYITAPADGSKLAAGQPITLNGGAIDAEDGSLVEGMDWYAGDIWLPGEGSERLLFGMPPGSYEFELEATDSDDHTGTATTSVEINDLAVPRHNQAPLIDGRCDDTVWENGVQLQLKPYDDGSQASVALMRTSNHLWACFSGLARGEQVSSAGIRIDPDGDSGSYADENDYAFLLTETGASPTYAGEGDGGFWNEGPSGLVGQIATSTNGWTAEMRIEASVLGGWDHLSRMIVGHWDVDGVKSGYGYHWPYSSIWNSPDSWASTVLGDLPVIDHLEPDEGMAADAFFVLVHGEYFSSGAEVFIDGDPHTTAVLSDTLLMTSVEATDFPVGQEAEVIVVNNGVSGSNPSFLTIRNASPVITHLTPDSAPAGSSVLALAVEGSGFVQGATVLWNGNPLASDFGDSSVYWASVPEEYLELARTVEVTVINPAPHSGSSNSAEFVVGEEISHVSADDVQVCESEGPASLFLTLDSSSATAISINYSTVDGSATAPADYAAATGTIVIPSGQLSALIEIPIVNDGVTEGQESFTVNLNSTTAPIATPQISVVVMDVDQVYCGGIVCASDPYPADGATNVALDVMLSWAAVPDANSYDVYIGTETDPPLATNVFEPTYKPPTLAVNETYFWKVIPKGPTGEALGCQVWQLTTTAETEPPLFADGFESGDMSAWSGSAGKTFTCDFESGSMSSWSISME